MNTERLSTARNTAKKDKLFCSAVVMLLALSGLLPSLSAEPPSLLDQDNWSPPVSNDPELPPYSPPPPPMTKFTVWEEGRIVDTDEAGFIIMAERVDEYVVEWNPDIVNSNWTDIAVIGDTNAILKFVHDNPEGFYRVRGRASEPYPPYGLGNFNQIARTNNANGIFSRDQ